VASEAVMLLTCERDMYACTPPIKHAGSPAFVDVATAADGDGACISEADLIGYKNANPENDAPNWEDLPEEYSGDGCIDETEFNALTYGDKFLGMKHARAYCEDVHRSSVSVPLAFCISRR